MKKISCVYSTARPSRAMVGREGDHMELYLDCLSRQTLQMDDFEVIIADCYHSRRPAEHRARDNRYRWKLYPLKPRSSLSVGSRTTAFTPCL